MESIKTEPNKSTGDYNWTKLYKIGGISAFIIISIIPIQIIIFTLFPPPETAIEFIDLFHENWIIGLLSLDFLYYINNALLLFVYIGLFASLRRVDFANMLIAIIIGFIGIAAYYASTVGFEMFALSKQYYLNESNEVKQQVLATAHGLIAKYKGTAFNVYYVLNAITLLIISKTMLKSQKYTRTTAIWGFIAGLLMIIPSTAGTIGLIFSLISLIPWIVFSVLIGGKLLSLSKHKE